MVPFEHVWRIETMKSCLNLFSKALQILKVPSRNHSLELKNASMSLSKMKICISSSKRAFQKNTFDHKWLNINDIINDKIKINEKFPEISSLKNRWPSISRAFIGTSQESSWCLRFAWCLPARCDDFILVAPNEAAESSMLETKSVNKQKKLSFYINLNVWR